MPKPKPASAAHMFPIVWRFPSAGATFTLRGGCGRRLARGLEVLEDMYVIVAYRHSGTVKGNVKAVLRVEFPAN